MLIKRQIRLLVVEDNPDKLVQVESMMRAKLESAMVSLQIDSSVSYTDAVETLKDSFYDFVILDLCIPLKNGGDARIEFGAQLLAHIKRLRQRPFLVLGLTTFEPVEYLPFFVADQNFKIEKFDSDGSWVDLISEQVEYIEAAKSAFDLHSTNSYGFDLIIVTARKMNEYNPIVDYVNWLAGKTYVDERIKDLRCVFGRVRFSDAGELDVGIVCLDEMGLSHSAAMVSRLISTFRPRYFVMLGMCCGFKAHGQRSGTKLGDVVIATETSCWDEGKYEDAKEQNTESVFFSNRAKNVSPDSDWIKTVSRIVEENANALKSSVKKYYLSQDLVHINLDLAEFLLEFRGDADTLLGSIVSGSCVVNSQEVIDRIQNRFPRAIGLEMEAHAVYSSLECMNGIKPKTLVIKGVADFGDGSKAKVVQPLASVASYLVLLKIIGEAENSII